MVWHRGRERIIAGDANVVIFGLLPILLFRLRGKQIERPPAIVMTGGLVTSTIFRPLVLPTIYRFAGTMKIANDERGFSGVRRLERDRMWPRRT